MTPVPTDSLSRYVPPMVVTRLAGDPTIIPTPSATQGPGACMFVDIAGFTRLTERLGRIGPGGAERMADILDRHFGTFIRICSERGGQVVDFQGDALLVVWWGDGREPAQQAAAAAAALHESLGNLPDNDDIGLSIKTAVVAGRLESRFVGGVAGRKRCYLTGQPLRELATLDRHTAPHVTVSTRSIAELLHGRGAFNEIASGVLRIDAVDEPSSPDPWTPPPLRPPAHEALLEFVPIPVAELPNADEGWLAEFRRVTSVFVRIYSADDLDFLNQAVVEIQESAHQRDGVIQQLVDGDKGTVAMVVFGLPPRAHEDDPARGVMTALDIEDRLASIGLRTAIGITTGRVFCGALGSDVRRDFTVVGEVVNLAARLMQNADDDILCDTTTARSYDLIDYDTLEPIVLKGIAEPVTALRPTGSRPRSVRARARAVPLVGRRSERDRLLGALEALGSEDPLPSVLITGEAGIGKTRLAEELIREALLRDVTVHRGTGSQIEKSTPYLAWQPILAGVLRLDEAGPDPGARRRHVLRRLAAMAEIRGRAWLLNDVLGLQLPMADQPSDPAAETRKVVRAMIEDAARRSPAVIVVEDVQWLDDSSAQLLGDVAGIPGILLVMLGRPGEIIDTARGMSPPPDEFELARLSETETLDLVARSLEVDSLPVEVATLISTRAEGHPFFAEELTFALRDIGVIDCSEGQCRVSSPKDLAGSTVPDTVQGAITSRVDRLGPEARLVFRAASVVGDLVDRSLLAAIGAQDLGTKLDSPLNELAEAGLLVDAGADTWRFRHAITRDVAYQSLPFAQRRRLHRTIAGYLESSSPDAHARLAHHWLQSVDDEAPDTDALRAGERHAFVAGLSAVRQGAFPEARRSLIDALTALRRLPQDGRDQRHELDVLRNLGTATFATAGYGSPATRTVFDEALERAEGLLDDTDLFPLLWGSWITAHFSDATDRALALGRRLVDIAELVDDDELRLQAHHAMWTTLVQIPGYKEARRHLEAGIRLYRPQWHESHTAGYGGHDPGSCAQRAVALTSWTIGLPDSALAAALRGVELAGEHDFSALSAMLALVFVHRQRGETSAVRREAAALTSRAEASGFPGMAGWAQALDLWARGRDEGPGKAVAELERVLLNLGLKDPGYWSMLVEFLSELGDTGRGLSLTEELFGVVDSRNQHVYEPELHRLRGELLKSGDPYRAQTCFRDALALSEEQGALSFALRAATSLADLDPRDATSIELLRDIYERFTEGFDTADLRRARALLDR